MIESGKIPVVYTVENTEVIVSNINSNVIPTVAIIALVVEAIIFIVIFKLNGIIASILQIGYIALLLLVLKYTNVIITLEGLFAIILAGIINMIFIYKVLQDVKKDINVVSAVNKSIIKFVNMSIPLLIVAIVFCFVKYLGINSFGMVIFWGYVISLLYNIVFTKMILKNTLDK